MVSKGENRGQNRAKRLADRGRDFFLRSKRAMRQLGENAVDEKMALGHFDHWRCRRLLPRGGGREEGRDEEKEQQRRQGARHHEAEGVAVDENSTKSIYKFVF